MSEPLKAVEADAENGGPEGIVVPLVTAEGDFEVTVPPPGSWKSRASNSLGQGMFQQWAEIVLTEDDYETWCEADPTNDEVETFFQAWKDATGEDLGKSRRSARSSRSTRKR